MDQKNDRFSHRSLTVRLLAMMIALGAQATGQLVVSITSPYATRGTAYSGQAIAGGGTSPYSFVITLGALPPGLQMDSTGAISGTPTHAGNYSFTITATDAAKLSGSGNASIMVAGTPLAVSPPGIMQGHVGVAYAPVTMTISGGVPPYTLSLTNALPPGMTFDTTAWVLAGTPTAGGNYSIDFLVTDQAGDASTFAYDLPVPDVIPVTASDGALTTPYGMGFFGIGFSVMPTIGVVSGTLPPGVSFSSLNNSLSGTPTQAGTFTFTLQATGGSLIATRVYAIHILSSPPISIAQSLPFGTVGQPYSQTIAVFNATPPLTFTVTGGTMPPGLTLSTSGVLSGTPTHAGSYGIDVTVQDSTGKTGTGGVSVAFLPPPLSVSPATIPDGAVGQDYSVTFSGAGGVPPYRYYQSLQVVPGLMLDSVTGALTGKPTSGGTYNIQINVSDYSSATGSRIYTFNISGSTPPFTVSPTTLPGGTAGKLYGQVITASGSPLPVHFALSSGSLPPGLVFNTGIVNGVAIGGTPTTPGLYQFQLTATDTSNQSISQNYSINIASQAITVSPNSLPAAIATVPYSVGFSATGGTPPYVFSMTGIAGGLQFSASGMLQGSPALGNWNFTVQAIDSKGVTGSWDYLLVVAQPTVTVTPLQLPTGAIGKPYSTLLGASGGAIPYTFSLSSGALPNGVTLSPGGTLAGAPQQAGMFNISITAQDATGAAGSRAYQLIINGVTITLGPSSLPDAFINQPYLAHLTASGGTPPYTFTRPSANSWVVGLQVASDGTISGTPINSGAALLDFTIQAADANGSTSSGQFQINLRSGVIALVPSMLPSRTVGTAYNSAITASGGSSPYTFSVAVGSLPSGLSLSTVGMISGTPASAGNYPFTVQAQDFNGATGTQAYVLTIVAAPSQGSCTYGISPGGKVFSPTGGTGTIDITTDASCSWTITNVPSWITFKNALSGAGSGTATFQLGLNSGADLSAVVMVAGQTFTVEQQASSLPGMTFAGSMPHVAAEENWTTAFTLVNKSVAAATARFSLFGDPYDASGTGPLTLPLIFPQLLPMSSPVLGASLDRTLSANASLIVETAGPQTPPVQIGSAQLAATNSVDGFAIFHHVITQQEAVVPLEVRNASSYLLAFDNTNGVVLGVALQNVSAQAANIPVVIRDDTGALIGPPGASISLAGNGHISFVLSDSVNGFPVTANIRGTIEFDTPAGGQISVLGIRFTPPNNALTTIPALANVGTNGGSIAHLASGGDGWQTTFVLVNVGSGAAQATLSFFADITGNPLPLPLSFPQSGSGTATVASTVTQTLAAGATFLAVSSGSVDLLTGSAQLSTTGNVGGFVIFRHNDQEAVVPLESRNANAYVLAFDNTNGTATGVAINSVSAQAVTVPVVIRDDTGTQIATDTLNLAPNGHSAFTLAVDKYLSTANIRGTIEFDTPSGGQIGALALRIPAGVTHTFTTLPALAK